MNINVKGQVEAFLSLVESSEDRRIADECRKVIEQMDGDEDVLFDEILEKGKANAYPEKYEGARALAAAPLRSQLRQS